MKRKVQKPTPHFLVQKKTYSIRITSELLSIIARHCKAQGVGDQVKAQIEIFVSIVLKQLLIHGGSRGVTISHKVWKKVFGSAEYSSIKKHALASGAVEVTGKYNPYTHIATRYLIRDNYKNSQTVVYYPNISKISQNRHVRFVTRQFSQAIEEGNAFNDDRARIQNLFLMEFRGSMPREEADAILSNLYHEGACNNDEYNRNSSLIEHIFNGNVGVHKVGKDGRLYNPLVFIGKEFRKFLLADYNILDISSSHPFILSAILMFITSSNERIVEKKSGILSRIKLLETSFEHISDSNGTKKLLPDILVILEYLVAHLNKGFRKTLSKKQRQYFNLKNIDYQLLIDEIKVMNERCCVGQFYDYIISSLEKEYFDWRKLVNCTKVFDKVKKDIDPQHLKTGDLTGSEKKALVKKSFMLFLNSKPTETRKYPPKEIFHIVFPNLSRFLDLIKATYGQTVIRNLVALSESILVYGTIHKLHQRHHVNIGSIHDAFVIPKKFSKNIVTNMICKESIKLFNTSPHLH